MLTESVNGPANWADAGYGALNGGQLLWWCSGKRWGHGFSGNQVESWVRRVGQTPVMAV